MTLPFGFPRPLGSRFALSCRWSRRASPTSDRGTERREREAKWHRSFRLSVNEAVAGGECVLRTSARSVGRAPGSKSVMTSRKYLSFPLKPHRRALVPQRFLLHIRKWSLCVRIRHCFMDGPLRRANVPVFYESLQHRRCSIIIPDPSVRASKEAVASLNH